MRNLWAASEHSFGLDEDEEEDEGEEEEEKAVTVAVVVAEAEVELAEVSWRDMMIVGNHEMSGMSHDKLMKTIMRSLELCLMCPLYELVSIL